MTICALKVCRNHKGRLKTTKKATYHRFPKDPKRKEKWINATGRQIWFPAKTSTICSEHFEEADFLIKGGRKYLADTAEPKFKIINFQPDTSQSIDLTEQNRTSIYVGGGARQEVCSVPQYKQKHHDLTNSPPHKRQSIDNASAAFTPRKRRLEELLRWKENQIKRKNLRIGRLKAKNQRLKKKVKKMEDIINAYKKNSL